MKKTSGFQCPLCFKTLFCILIPLLLIPTIGFAQSPTSVFDVVGKQDTSTKATPFSMDEVIEKVNHFVDEDTAKPDVYFSKDVSYFVEFEKGELRFIPWASDLDPKEREEADTFHFRFDSLSRGEVNVLNFLDEDPVIRPDENRIVFQWGSNIFGVQTFLSDMR